MGKDSDHPADVTSSLEQQITAESDAVFQQSTPDSKAEAHVGLRLEESTLQAEELRLKLKEAKAKIKQLKDTRKLRKHYAKRALGFAEVAIGAWLFLFTFAATMNLIAGRPFLSDQALMTLTAGATINVLAAFLGIIRGLFPSSNGKETGNDTEKK